MRKFLIILAAAMAVAGSLKSQTLIDSTGTRSYINANIVTNGSNQITAAMLNRIMNGYLNIWAKYGIDSVRKSNDTVYYRKDRQWRFGFKLPATVGGINRKFQYNNAGTIDGTIDGIFDNATGLTRYLYGYSSAFDALQTDQSKMTIRPDTVIDGTEELTNPSFTGNADDWDLTDDLVYGTNNLSGCCGSASQTGALISGDYYTATVTVTGTEGVVGIFIDGSEAALINIHQDTVISITRQYFPTMLAVKLTLVTTLDFDGTIESASVKHTIVQRGLTVKGMTHVNGLWMDNIIGYDSPGFLFVDNTTGSVLPQMITNEYISDLAGSKISGSVPLADNATTATNATNADNATNATNADNATTVTDGVYTTGSYSNPSWITALDVSKITNSNGLYNPTFADFTNVDSVQTSTLGNQVSWSTLGDIVTISGDLSIDVTAANTYTVFTMTLPVNAASGNVWNGGGSTFADLSNNLFGAVYLGRNGLTKIDFKFKSQTNISTPIGVNRISFTYSYRK